MPSCGSVSASALAAPRRGVRRRRRPWCTRASSASPRPAAIGSCGDARNQATAAHAARTARDAAVRSFLACAARALEALDDCKILPVTSPAARAALVLPALLWHLELTLGAEEFRRELEGADRL